VVSLNPVARQVVTVHPDGTMSSLQRKRGQGLDLRLFGPVEIERASSIVWNDTAQAWEIELQMQPFTGTRVSATHWAEAGYTLWPEEAHAAPDDQQAPFLFDDYDDAVAVEIRLLDGLRIRGRLRGKSGEVAADRGFGTFPTSGSLRELPG
jgi:hypothetical protein